jgi:histidinol-phosphatase (PHP family)
MYDNVERSTHPTWLQDYHLHTAVTIDGRMNEAEACERALMLGINEIAFTNHVMLNQPDYKMSAESFSRHWAKIQECQIKYPNLQIRLGLEMDYYPDRQEEIRATMKSYEYLIGHHVDIVLGSIHEIRGGFFSSKAEAVSFFKDRDLLSLYNEYFELATQAAESHLFDVMAHPDLIKKYTGQLTPPVPFDCYRHSVEPFITALINHRIGIEVNTKGLKLAVNEAYPSMQFLELYLAMTKSCGLDPIITLGSDAHKVDDLGYGVRDMVGILSRLGVGEVMSFEVRKMMPKKLNESSLRH